MLIKLAPVLTAIAHTTTAATKTASASLASQVAIKEDDEINAIVISAPQQIMQTLLSVVKQLDQHPAQVLVEAVIAQVDESAMSQLGVTWGTTESGSGSTSDSDTGTSTATSPVQFPGVGIIKSGNFRALISALRGNTSTNILSTPSIVVVNNQKSRYRNW